MTSLARIRPSLRRAAFMAALGALMVPATAGAAVHAEAAAKKKKKSHLPVVTRVTPMHLQIGQTLEIRGHYFLRGRNKNTVVFKRNGGRAVFVKALIGTTKLLRVTVPAKLAPELNKGTFGVVATRFRIRILTKKFGKRFTKASRSPLISPASPVGTTPGSPGGPPSLSVTQPAGDCDHDGKLNRDDIDDDNDLVADSLEATLGTDPCNADTDGDSVSDGFEYQSAIDLNNDEYQDPNVSLPYPGKRPYPNPLDSTDANTDYDGDSLTLGEEQGLWKYAAARQHEVLDLKHLDYSDGLKYSIYKHLNGDGDRRTPNLRAAGYERTADFENWLNGTNGYSNPSGYATVFIPATGQEKSGKSYKLRDVNRDDTVSDGRPVSQGGRQECQVDPTPPCFLHSEDLYLDTGGAVIRDTAGAAHQAPNGFLSDDERDEDADGLSNYDETHGPLSAASWWSGVYPGETVFHITYAGTRPDDADSDGDGVRDGADDQDHDDIPNIMEMSRNMATGRPPGGADVSKDPAFGRVNPFNPCLPDRGSRTCPTFVPFEGAWAPFDGSADYLVLN
jgi:hypothetical protein